MILRWLGLCLRALYKSDCHSLFSTGADTARQTCAAGFVPCSRELAAFDALLLFEGDRTAAFVFVCGVYVFLSLRFIYRSSALGRKTQAQDSKEWTEPARYAGD